MMGVAAMPPSHEDDPNDAPPAGERLGAAPGEQSGAALGEQLGDATGEQLGPALREQLGPAPGEQLGDAAGEKLSDPQDPAPGEQLGPAPQVVGRSRIRDGVRARLFGERAAGPDEPQTSSRPTPGSPSSEDSGPIPTHRIGRFRIQDRIGHGGMGVVYRAYDPELDRPVAIKVLRPDVDDSGARDAQARLLREAQAMARLSDPNVIVVHEVGTVDDRVFVAMEYVQGPTLRRWLRERPPWTEVLSVFMAAGRGLAAAHRAGLIHRDFKPENVLIDGEGRVKVLDFGLARAVGEEQGTLPVVAGGERPDVDSLHTPLTRTGAVMGTPAYMAPEQLLGHPADARSDQFSFCVALYEGLFGKRPFAGDNLATLSMNVVRGRMRETPAEVRVPSRVLAALRRGLSVDPDARFEQMEALLRVLPEPPARWWRRGIAVVAVGIAASVGTAALWTEDPASACVGFDERLAGIWDAETHARVRAAIEGTGRDFAPRVAQTTIDMLDAYADRWVEQAEDACGAALVAAEDDVAERRQDCLEQRRVELGALVEALGEAGDGMVHAAVTATADLTDLGACADPRRLSAQQVVDDPAVRQQLANARAQLARAKAKGALGRYDEAVTLASDVIDQAETLGSAPLQAMGWMIRGTYRERAGDVEGAEADLRHAVQQAQSGGDRGTQAQAMVRLVWVVGRDRGRYEQARELGIETRAVLELIGAPPLLHADLDNNLGSISRRAGALDDARTHHQAALDRRLKVLGEDHPDVGRSLIHIGNVLSAQRQMKAAEDHLRRGVAHAQRTLGPDHPSVAGGLSSLAFCLAKSERPEEALVQERRALEIYEHSFGADHPDSLRARFNLARIAQNLGRHAEATALLTRGLELREQEVSPDDPKLRGWLDALGTSELALGLPQAAGHLDRVLAMRQAQGIDDARLARHRFALAQALVDRDPPRARRLALAADAALSAAAREDQPLGAEDPARALQQQVREWLEAHPRAPAPGRGD